MRRLYWAIQTRGQFAGKPRPGYIGVYWFQPGYNHPPFQACTTALFKTRREAREHLPRVKIPYGHRTARIVRVEIVEAK